MSLIGQFCKEGLCNLDPMMDHNYEQYDIFEKLPDGNLEWRTVAPGLEAANHQLAEHAAQTRNEVLIMHLPTSTHIASMKIRQPVQRELKIGAGMD
jgi:hypothetical protein